MILTEHGIEEARVWLRRAENEIARLFEENMRLRQSDRLIRDALSWFESHKIEEKIGHVPQWAAIARQRIGIAAGGGSIGGGGGASGDWNITGGGGRAPESSRPITEGTGGGSTVAAERERCARETQSYITRNTGDITLAKLVAAEIRKGE